MDIKTLIGSNIRPDGASSGTARPRGAAGAAEQTTARADGKVSEEVTFTAAAKTMHAAQDTASTVPFEEAKVADIKAAISEGRYPIDNERLASRMTSFERLLA